MTNYYCLVAGLPDLSLEDGKLNYTVLILNQKSIRNYRKRIGS